MPVYLFRRRLTLSSAARSPDIPPVNTCTRISSDLRKICFTQRDPAARPTAAELLQHPFVAAAEVEPASLRDRIIAYAASPRSVALLEARSLSGSGPRLNEVTVKA
jgi:hypothetical protein